MSLGLMLQWGGAYGFSDLLNQLEALGFFRYILPFLLIFAVVYAVLTKVPVFKANKGAAVVVAFAIGLLALQFDVVPAFFQNIMPKFGIGIAFLLIALILAGAFLPEEKYKWIFFGVGMFIFLVIVVTSLSDWRFLGSWWWQQYGTLIIVVIAVIGLLLAVILPSFIKGSKEEIT